MPPFPLLQKSWLTKLWWLLPALLAGIVYANTLGHGFVWDDFYLITEDHTVKSFKYLDVIFTSDFFGHQENELAYGYYRPLVSLSYLLDYTVWQKNPLGYHLTNILLHIVATLLVVAVAVELRLSRKVALLIALLFAAHPMHTENVSWVSGRTDVLAFVFAAAALWAHLRSLRDGRTVLYRILAAASFFAALLSKEMAVVAPLWMGVAAISFRGRKPLHTLWTLAPYALVFALYLVLRFVIADVPGPYQRPEISMLARLAGAPFTAARYLAWLILPIEQSAYVKNPFITGPGDVRLYIGVFAIAALCAAVYRFRKQAPAAAAFFAMTLLSMGPIMGIVSASGPVDMGAVMAERFLYFPSFPFIAFAVTAVPFLAARLVGAKRGPRAATALAAICLVAFSFKTAVRNRDWQNNEVFYRRTLETVPSALIYCNLANHYIYTGQWDKAEKALLDAKRFTSNEAFYLASKTLLHVAKREYKEAIVYQKEVAANAKRGRAPAYNNLAFLYRSIGEYKKAEALLQEILDNDAGYADVYYNLAEVYRAVGRFDAAKAAFREALKRRPDNLRMAAAYAAMLVDRGELSTAVSVYETQLEMYRDDPGLLNNLGIVYKKMHRLDEAQAAFERAVASDPRYLKARLNLGGVLFASGKRTEAVAVLSRLVKEHPDSKEARAAAELLSSLEGREPSHPVEK